MSDPSGQGQPMASQTFPGNVVTSAKQLAPLGYARIEHTTSLGIIEYLLPITPVHERVAGPASARPGRPGGDSYLGGRLVRDPHLAEDDLCSGHTDNSLLTLAVDVKLPSCRPHVAAIG